MTSFAKSRLIALSLLALWTSGCAPDSPSGESVLLKPVRYDLKLKLNYDDEILSGHCELTVENPSNDSVRTIPLVLYRLLTITGVQDAGSAPLSFSQTLGSFSDFPQQQANHILIRLKRPLKPGDRTIIKMDYEGYLLGYAETGMLYVRDRIERDYTILRPDCLAYPEIGVLSHASNRAHGLSMYDYGIEITVPSGLVAANAGRLLSREEDGGETTFRYESRIPSWRMDIAIAPYKILEDLSAHFKIFYFEPDQAGADRIMDAMHRVLRLYSEWFGVLDDLRGFTVIEVPQGTGSQTDTAAVLQTRDAFVDPGHLDAFYHEMSHLWNPMSKESQPCRLESEGSAMFLQYLASEKLDGRSDAVVSGREHALNRFRKAASSNPRSLSTPIIDYGREGMTGLSYSKGMLFFNALYDILGEPEFLRILGDFFITYRKTGASTEEFLNFFEEHSTMDLNPFFEDWVLGTASSRDIMGDTSWDEMIRKYLGNLE